MTLLLAITAISFTALGAGIGIIAGHHLGHRTAREELEAREEERWGEIRHFDDLYEQPAYGDD